MKLLQNDLKKLFIIGLIFFSLAGVIYLQVDFLNEKQVLKSKSNYIRQENEEKIKVNFLTNAPTFGFDNLIADWAFLRFLQYFGDKPARQETGYSVVPSYLEAIVNQDPYFIDAYRAISPVSSIYAGRPKKTVRLLEKGLESLSPEVPNSYLVWIYKAHDELLLLGDTEAAAHSYAMAAKWASVHNDPVSQNVAKGARQTAQLLAKNPDSRRAQISSWAMVLSNALDKEVRQLAISHIEELGGEVIVNSQGRVRVKFPTEE